MLGRLAGTLDSSFDPKRTQEAQEEHTGRQITSGETESLCNSNLLRRTTDVKRQETQAEKHKEELWSRETILPLEEIQVAIYIKRSWRKPEMHK